MAMDKEKLKELAGDPKVSATEIYAAFGYKNDVTFYYHLKQDPELKRIYTEGRLAAKEARRALPKSAKKSAKAPRPRRKSGRKQKSSTSAPPRNGNAKGANKELFKKLQLEFEHIDVYGATSEHFDELRSEVGALI